MKNRKWLNITTSLVAATFILSIYSGLAAAQTPAEKYVNTEKKFEEARQLFEKANKELQNSRDPKSQDELKQRTRTYIDNAIDTMVARLEVVKYRLNLPENKGLFSFDASQNIDADIAKLEQIRTKLQQANTPQQMRDVHKELRNTWNNISLETRYYFEIMLNNRIDNFITKADNVTTRLDKAIEKAKSQNRDVTALQNDETQFKNQMADAQGIQQQISSLLTNHSGFASDGTVSDNKAALEFVRQVDKLQKDAIQKLRAASRQVLDFVRDFRKLSGGKVSVDRSGELEAGNNNTETTATVIPTVTVTSTATITPTATANTTVTPIINTTTTVTETATPTPTATATSAGNTSTNTSG